MSKNEFITILELYKEKFPEPVSYEEMYKRLHEQGHITKEQEDLFIRNKKKLKASPEDKRIKEGYDKLFENAGDSEQGRLTMSQQSYFHLMEHQKLLEARKTSKCSQYLSIAAIIIALASFVTTYYSFQSHLDINPEQIAKIVSTIKQLK